LLLPSQLLLLLLRPQLLLQPYKVLMQQLSKRQSHQLQRQCLAQQPPHCLVH
jgi:hypothetical protein